MKFAPLHDRVLVRRVEEAGKWAPDVSFMPRRRRVTEFQIPIQLQRQLICAHNTPMPSRST